MPCIMTAAVYTSINAFGISQQTERPKPTYFYTLSTILDFEWCNLLEGNWRKLHNYELHNLSSSLNIVSYIIKKNRKEGASK